MSSLASTSAPAIRRAAPHDRAAIAGVIERAYREYRSVLSPTLYDAYLTSLLDLDGHGHDAVLFVAEVDSAIVGTVALYPDAAAAGFGWPPTYAAIRALAVDPDHRGRGTAKQLIDECVTRATRSGATAIGLHTAAFMTAAIRLYERRGFSWLPSLDVRAGEVIDVGQADTPLIIAYQLGLEPEADTYPLGRSSAESQRLVLQAQLYGPITRQLMTSAGITRGMKVLDLGTGAGDVALLVADLVGPEGRVVGVDMNPEILDTARARVRAAGWSNVELHCGDVRDIELAEDFDAVVGRWILMYLNHPAALLRDVQRHLRPGGLMAFLESADLTTGVRAYPSTPLHDLLGRWMTPPPGAPGPVPDMGLRLRRTLLDAGLRTPQLRLEAPIGGGPDWPGYAFVASTLRSLLPFMEQIGAVTAAQADVDTLEKRLRTEVVASGAVQILPAVVSAWARRP